MWFFTTAFYFVACILVSFNSLVHGGSTACASKDGFDDSSCASPPDTRGSMLVQKGVKRHKILQEQGPDCGTAGTYWPEWCSQGNNMWNHDELKAAIPTFAEVYAQRPISSNAGGMNANHAFSLWFTVVHLRPKYIVESGVFHGQSTWFLRQAAPEAQIYSLDPENEIYLEHRDANSKTQYFMGDKFRDLADMDWDSLIPNGDRTNTLVMLDDHQSSMKRSHQLLQFGFVHVWYDDNWNSNYPAADCYSFNTVCAPAKSKTVAMKDNFGYSVEYIDADKHRQNSEWLSSHIEIYFEFPALFDGCAGHPQHNRHQALLSNESELLAMGFPSIQEDPYGYLHLYPPYVKLKP